jgi:hypothetical protein
MGDAEYQAAVAAFIHARGITRCPTACALPTQGIVAAADRAALRDYAIARDQSRPETTGCARAIVMDPARSRVTRLCRSERRQWVSCRLPTLDDGWSAATKEDPR